MSIICLLTDSARFRGRMCAAVYSPGTNEYIINMTEEIILKDSSKLMVEKRELSGNVEVLLYMKEGHNCKLHWGLSRERDSEWAIPPEPAWPAGSRLVDRGAVQTPFIADNHAYKVIVALDGTMNYSALVFAIYYPDTGAWDNNQGKNYRVALPVTKKGPSLDSVLEEESRNGDLKFKEIFSLGKEGSLAAIVKKGGTCYEVLLISDLLSPMILHWGFAVESRYEWTLPPRSVLPEGSVQYDNKAVQSPFQLESGMSRMSLKFYEEDAPLGIPFVIKLKHSDQWINNGKRDFFVPLTVKEEEGDTGLHQIAGEIIHSETGDHSWTLMHRFNLCHDLLDSVRNNEEGLAILYVWMRYSAIRQLDWQRRYNTQPRELSHAQDRLTLQIADVYIHEKQSREVLRLIISTLGRGGDGQRVRDEILQIMHRHHIKEVAGHFMEEWHQKLHNNTTPDDVVICEAYLEFLKSDGDLDRYYKTLGKGGISRKRMESYDRPITTPPDFIPGLKKPLLHDFENYLTLLKSVHSGTDLQSAMNGAGYLMSGELGELLSAVWRHRFSGEEKAAEVVRKIIRARLILNDRLDIESDLERTRDMLFLDLALEDFNRIVIERSVHTGMNGDALVELTGMVMENMALTWNNDELSECIREWNNLLEMERFSVDWSLHAKAVLERISRVTGYFVDRCHGLFQSKAGYLGRAFKADAWTISVFTEEVVRSMPVFVLSLLIRHLDPLLRSKADLGDWQVISTGTTGGWVEIVDSLASVQGSSFERPVIIVADKVMGDEEPPEGAVAIITADTVDLVSHISVRARNAHLLFASCYSDASFDSLKSLRGRRIHLDVSVSGDVVFSETSDMTDKSQEVEKFEYEIKEIPECAAYALSSAEFSDGLVGGKSLNLRKLENSLPDWIHLPVSVALPFGTFEKVLNLDINKEINNRYHALLRRVDRRVQGTLNDVRGIIRDLHSPEELESELNSIMNDSGLEPQGPWDNTWTCIKRVWASKWNERAYFSRSARGIRHEDIFMAVLIQQVIDAEYAFVIHTVNPSSGNRGELYAEVVPGLGETLVGNYPGRALSFISDKKNPEPQISSYPSKSTGLYGGGMIYRSDSNGEDLLGYAGAGLYDSVMLEPPREVLLSYIQDPLTRDEKFKKEFLTAITKIGTIVEEQVGLPQDIEGVYSNGRYFIVQTRPQVGLK